MPLERTQLLILKDPPLALNSQNVRTILLTPPELRNEQHGFFIESSGTYKSLLFFPEKEWETNYLIVNGADFEKSIIFQLAEHERAYAVPARSLRFIRILKKNPEVYWDLVFQYHIIPFRLTSETSWEWDELYDGSPSMGMYICQPAEFPSPRKDIYLRLTDRGFDKYTIFGWIKERDSAPWDNGRWAGETLVSCCFIRPEEGKDYELTMQARSPFPGQKVTVFWGTEKKGVFNLGEEITEISFTIKADEVSTQKPSLLWLEHSILDIPADYSDKSRQKEPCTAFYENLSMKPIEVSSD
jgi:hypothetical protein